MTSSVVYGCMQLGRWDRQPIGPEQHGRAEAAVEAALEAGIDTFDHADIYGHGTAETVFGELLSRSPGLRPRIRIQSKCGIRLADGDRPGLYDLRPATIRERVHQSLERLQTDYLDTLLLHRPDPLADPADVAAALDELFEEGLVLAVGVSNMSAAQIEALQRHTELPVTVNQLEMSLLARAWLEGGVLVNTASYSRVGFPHGTIEHCRTHGISLQAWGALAGGRFTGMPRDPQDELVAALVASLAERHATTPESVLLGWLQRHPAQIVPVIGTTSPERIRACRDAAAGSVQLDHDEWYELWTTARGGPLP